MEKKNMKLSVAIAVYNEEKNLDACLASVCSWVDEIVVVDGGSTDKTIEIAKKYTERNGGYTTMAKLEARQGDNAPQVLIALVD